MKLLENLQCLKDLDVLKLHIEHKKSGAVTLNTITKTITRAGGWGYDKRSQVFYQFFIKMGFNVTSCKSEFDLFHYSIDQANQFLKQNNINYTVFYKSAISESIDFIELSKI